MSSARRRHCVFCAVMVRELPTSWFVEKLSNQHEIPLSERPLATANSIDWTAKPRTGIRTTEVSLALRASLTAQAVAARNVAHRHAAFVSLLGNPRGLGLATADNSELSYGVPTLSSASSMTNSAETASAAMGAKIDRLKMNMAAPFARPSHYSTRGALQNRLSTGTRTPPIGGRSSTPNG